MESRLFANREENMVAEALTHSTRFMTRNQLIRLLIGSGLIAKDAKILISSMAKSGLIEISVRNVPARTFVNDPQQLKWSNSMVRPRSIDLRSYMSRWMVRCNEPYRPCMVVRPGKKLLGLLGMELPNEPLPESMLPALRLNEIMILRASVQSFRWLTIAGWMNFDFDAVCAAALQRSDAIPKPNLVVVLKPVRAVDVQLFFNFLLESKATYEVY